MASAGFTDTIYVVASTDMLRVPIMLNRIEEQMKTLKQLQTSGTLKLSAEAIDGVVISQAQTIEQQVQAVARRVEETILAGTAHRQLMAASLPS